MTVINNFLSFYPLSFILGHSYHKLSIILVPLHIVRWSQGYGRREFAFDFSILFTEWRKVLGSYGVNQTFELKPLRHSFSLISFTISQEPCKNQIFYLLIPCRQRKAKRSDLAVETFFHSHPLDFQKHDISVTIYF